MIPNSTSRSVNTTSQLIDMSDAVSRPSGRPPPPKRCRPCAIETKRGNGAATRELLVAQAVSMVLEILVHQRGTRVGAGRVSGSTV